MTENFLYPSKVEHRISELTLDSLSNETKANVARWYAEMMIKEFLSEYFDGEKYKKESLSYLINELKGKVSEEIINSLMLIKDFGDKASHYDPDKKFSKKHAQKAVDEAKNLYELIILNTLKKKSLYFHPDRATLLSVLLPDIRVSIYTKLIDFESWDIDQDLLKKWCLACVKNRKSNKAISRLNQLKKKGQISNLSYTERFNDIKTIKYQMDNDKLPIPKNRSDFARNLDDVLSNVLSEESKVHNDDLITVLNSMAENVSPSDMKHYKGMQIFAS
jgi:HEPN domain-containing protein